MSDRNMQDIVSTILCSVADDFRSCSRAFASLKGDLKSRKSRALKFSFGLFVDHNIEVGFRSLDVMLWAPTNYVCVISRESWYVLPFSDIDGDVSRPRPKQGSSWTDGNTGYRFHAYHDQKWRDEGVKRVLGEYKERIEMLRYDKTFYDVVTLWDAELSEFKKLISAANVV